MQSNKMNTVLFLKNVESNLIDEAIIVVKGNIKISNSKNANVISKNTLLKEAELIVNNKIEENNKELLEFKISKLVKKNKLLKKVNIGLILLVIIFFLT